MVRFPRKWVENTILRSPALLNRRISCGSENFRRFYISAHPKLVREYIEESLYNLKSGYFSECGGNVVGQVDSPIQFKELSGQQEYKTLISNLYKKSDKSWLTPVEIFKPWYGYAVGEYILRMHKCTSPLKIFEVGGGSGTLALSVLEYLKNHASSDVNKGLEYVSVEISPSLAQRQLSRVRSELGGSNVRNFRSVCGSALSKQTWAGEESSDPCFVILLEVLDNLVHDRLVKNGPAEPWMETQVLETSSQHPLATAEIKEVLVPLQDELAKRCFETCELGVDPPWWRSVVGGNRPRIEWVPTGLMSLLETLHTCVPNMTLVIADFSSLPDVRIPGNRAPLVASKTRGVTSDHGTYLVPPGSCDIFFPTDFELLRKLDRECARRANEAAGNATTRMQSAIVPSREFMEEMADFKQVETKSGYNPLLEDFSNTKFYLSTPT